MTWIGAPTVYYGDEAGVCGFTDPDNRRTYPWGHENKELIAFHKEMIRIHKENPEIRSGSILDLVSEYQVIGYGRFNRREQSVILVNNGEHEVKKELSVWELGIPKTALLEQLILTTADGFSTERREYPVISGKIQITLPATSAVVLKHRAQSRQEEASEIG